MLNVIDLSYYKPLPQMMGTLPKMLVSEITNEIEYYACVDTTSATINYMCAKILELMDIPHEPVYWGTDLRFMEQKFVTVTKFNLNQNWIYFNEKEVIASLKNSNDVNFNYLLAALFGSSIYNDDVLGYVNDDNCLVKSFHFNMVSEIELALYLNNNSKLAEIFHTPETMEELLDDDRDREIVKELEDHIKKFISIKKSDLFEALKFPKNEKFEKCKFWSVKKIMDAQKLVRKLYE